MIADDRDQRVVQARVEGSTDHDVNDAVIAQAFGEKLAEPLWFWDAGAKIAALHRPRLGHSGNRLGDLGGRAIRTEDQHRAVSSQAATERFFDGTRHWVPP